jgi:hypothetical protein
MKVKSEEGEILLLEPKSRVPIVILILANYTLVKCPWVN